MTTPAARASYNVGYDLKLALPLALFFLVFFIAPLLLLFFVSLHADTSMTRMGIDQFRRFLTDPFSLQVLGSTLVVGVEVTILCLVLGYPLAWLFVRSPGWLRTILILIILLPLLTSVIVRTFAWIVILGRLGIVNSTLMALGLIDTPLRLLYSEGGLVFALAQVHMPLMVLPLITALSRIDPSLADASSALGAGAWRTVLRITVPGTLAGIFYATWKGTAAPALGPETTTPGLGTQLMTSYILPFEIASVILVVALVGAAMTARRSRRKANG